MVTKKRNLLFLFSLLCLSCLLLFTACEDSEYPAKIELVQNPIKTQYFVGEQVDLTGAKFVVTYNNGNKEDVELDSEYIEYDVSFIENSTPGKKNITIVYNKVAEKRVFVNVEVNFVSIDLVKIELNQSSLPTIVKQNAKIDYSEVVAVATYSNGSTQNLTHDQLEFSEIDTKICGDHIVTVTFGGKSTYFSIYVDQLVVEEITFSGGVFNEYVQGDEIRLENILIQLALDDGTTVDFKANSPSIQLVGLSTSEKGSFEVVVRYVGDEYKLIDENIRGIHAYIVV